MTDEAETEPTCETQILDHLRRLAIDFADGGTARAATVQRIAEALGMREATVSVAIEHLAAEERICESGAVPGAWMLPPNVT
jgi:Mn-dependent DtxR family transcriptional regulator